MANKKNNKPASKAAAKPAEVKTAPAVEAVPEVKTAPVAETAPAAPAKAAETKKSTEAKKPAAKKPAAKKSESAKPAAKKTEAAKKPAEDKSGEFVIQLGHEKNYTVDQITELCKADYKGDNSRKQVRTIDVYVNVGEGKAYYVVNGKSEGKFVTL